MVLTMIKKLLIEIAGHVARSRPIQAVVRHFICPAVVDYLRDEVQADVVSNSGVVEAFAWKTQAYLVEMEELRSTGKKCVDERMPSDQTTRKQVIDAAVERVAAVEGDILEFGVYQGDSLRWFADRFPDRHVYGFDSFEGLPKGWERSPQGKFKTNLPNIDMPNVTLVKGLFEESLPRFLKEWSGRISIVHVDCVLYESTLACLEPLIPHVQVGTVVVFDEYYNYENFAHHEWLAWREVRTKHGLQASCVAYDGRRAAFRITELGRS
jgi:Macrocin-O-methyltransferase (TylF)